MALILLVSGTQVSAQSTELAEPLVNDKLIFEEKEGIVAVEAEYFYKQSLTEIRQWYRTSRDETPDVPRDDDAPHCYGASNNAYLEILPDERVTHSDKLIHGENFSDDPGVLAVIHYRVKFNTPGRYYVWARAMSTGGEDNGLHVGLNGAWPEHGQRMQWCDGRGHWTWGSKQRTSEVHCGVPHEIYLEIKEAGVHDIRFSMREDGFEFDKFILTTDRDYVPIEEGPGMLVFQGSLPAPFPKVAPPAPQPSYFRNIAASLPANKSIASQEFPADGTNFYKNGKNWLAINPDEHREAMTTLAFPFESGSYDLVFVGVGENDGRSTFRVLVNGKEIGSYSPPTTTRLWEEGRQFNALWENIHVSRGDRITVVSQVGSNDGKEWSRGRWAGLVFAPAGKGKAIQDAPSTWSPN